VPRPTKPPSYLKYVRKDGSAWARTVLFCQTIHLGPYGSKISHDRFAACQARWRARRAEIEREPANVPASPCGKMAQRVEDLLAHFWVYAERHYRAPDGQAKKELANYRAALRPLKRLCGDMAIEEFGPRALREVRDAMATGAWMTDEEKEECRARGRPVGWCRRVVNRNLARLRTMFRWLETDELLDAGRVASLCKIRGLEMEELGVRESNDRLPVPECDLAATLPRLRHAVRALVELQLLTGARPSELVKLRARDLRRDGAFEVGNAGMLTSVPGCWAYAPLRHKNSFRGKKHSRVILFGPKAQAVLAPFLANRQEDDYLFSPRETVAAWRAEQRRKRKTKVQPSQVCRATPCPRRRPGAHYTVGSYARAIYTACGQEPVIPAWSPYRLRHNAATRLRDQFGWEIARLILGHSTVQTTQIYVLDSWAKAGEAMQQTG
jgi:integrase